MSFLKKHGAIVWLGFVTAVPTLLYTLLIAALMFGRIAAAPTVTRINRHGDEYTATELSGSDITYITFCAFSFLRTVTTTRVALCMIAVGTTSARPMETLPCCTHSILHVSVTMPRRPRSTE